jgi:hypothetical protein
VEVLAKLVKRFGVAETMPRGDQQNPDPKEIAARIVGEATAASADTASDAEAAWVEWSRQLQKVHEREILLLRAAFEAGWSLAEHASWAKAGKLHAGIVFWPQSGRKIGHVIREVLLYATYTTPEAAAGQVKYV